MLFYIFAKADFFFTRSWIHKFRFQSIAVFVQKIVFMIKFIINFENKKK